MSTETQIELLKKKIAEAYDRLGQGGEHCPELAQNSLDIAENYLLQAEHAHGTHKAGHGLNFLRMAEMRYKLALMHCKAPPENHKKLNSLLSEHRVGTLGNSILAFKTKVEWQNTELTMAQRHLFTELVNLFEDALNRIRNGNIEEAKRITSGALLYYHHLCCLVSDQQANSDTRPDTKKGLLGLLTQHPEPTPTSELKSLSNQMLQLHAQFEQLQIESKHSKAEWHELEDLLDELITQAISALIEDNKNTMLEARYRAQTQLVHMKRFVRDLRSAPESPETDIQLKSDEPSKTVVSRRQFQAMTDTLKSYLQTRVTFPEQIVVRLRGLRVCYDQAMRAYENHLSFEAEFLLSNAFFELQSIELMVKQALLFSEE